MTVSATMCISLLTVLTPGAASAASTDVVISELMYHAPDPNEVEFLELYNRGGSTVDLSGWSFSSGITLATAGLALPSGATIPAGGRLVLTSDSTLFQAQYGFAADFSYAGTSLSNGGEVVTLVDAGAAVIDTVAYDDAAPWTAAPDGGGPSLELVDAASDNALAASWAASSVDFGTPRAVNTVEQAPPISISGVVATPARPAPGQPFTVRAVMPAGSTATLTYKVMFGADVTVPMLDDATSPGGAGDGVFAVSIPGAGAGELVRYRVDTTSGEQSAGYPEDGDSRAYDGVVVTDPELDAAKFPVLEWFMSDADYEDLRANHRCDDVTAPAVITYGGRVFDGAEMKIKGHSTCQDDKAKWSVELPKGHPIDLGEPFAYPLDEFDFQSESAPVPRLGWEMIETAGDPPLRYQTFRTQRNGSFHSVVGVLENYDGTWRTQRGYDDWSVYKVQAGGLRTYGSAAELAASGDIDLKNPDDGDFADVWELTQVLSQPDSASKRAWMYANFDIPQMTNFTALLVAMRQWDSGSKNYYVVRDAEGDGRWRILHWDLDGILNAGNDVKGDFVIPSVSNPLWGSLMAVPEIKAMHFRRVRTLHDQFLVGDGLLNRFDELTVCCAADILLDNLAWDSRKLRGWRNKVITGVQERRDQIAAHTGPAEIPVSQSASPSVVINEIQYNPAANGDAEYVELYNPSASESVDLSGWTFDGLGTFSIPPGTVLLPQAHLVYVKDDNAFRDVYGGGHLVGGEFPGSLDDAGDTLTLRDGTRTVDTVAYTNTAPWPAEADGTGPSLELRDHGSDNADPASWGTSTNTGTPSAHNSISEGGPPPPPPGDDAVALDFGSTWKYLATGADQQTAWRATAFDDSAWPSGRGDLGFRNRNSTTIQQTTGRTTYYFRTTFSVPDGDPVTGVTLDLLRDDGAVVYVNGVEAARSNMPSGTVGFTTRASAAVNGDAEDQSVTITLPPTALVTGTNSIAVEVHQRSTGSAADLTMDARVTVER